MKFGTGKNEERVYMRNKSTNFSRKAWKQAVGRGNATMKTKIAFVTEVRGNYGIQLDPTKIEYSPVKKAVA